jgi:plasmid stabilization system protein ParE
VRIVWRAAAERALDRKIARLRGHNPYAADRIAERVERRVRALVEFPFTGRPSAREGVRELVISETPFIAVYRVDGDVITILRFFHAAQDR